MKCGICSIELLSISYIRAAKGQDLKRIVVSVINDLSFDQRVDKTCSTLHSMGYDVLLIGRKLPDSKPLKRAYATHRMRLLFKKGAQFYAFYNIRLFLKLLFTKADALHANDLDTLLANRLASRIKRVPLVYDSHEYFTEVPEIQNRPIVKKTWKKIEKSIFPRLKDIITVNDSIADLYSKEYNKEVKVLRNLPSSVTIEKLKNREDLGMPLDKKVVILQGAGINIDRGAEELLEGIALMENTVLYVVGSGDVIDQLKDRAKQTDLLNKVVFIDKQPFADMMQYTMNADAGVTLDKDTNLNYRFSLPNKIFDYLKAGIPILATDLVEVKKIVEGKGVGIVIPNLEPESIKQGLEAIWGEEASYNKYKLNVVEASKELNWEKESGVIKEIYNRLLS